MNRVVHFEIHADDVERAKKFYQDIFGWEMQQMGAEYGNYVVVKMGPGPDEIAKGSIKMEDLGINGGMMKRNSPKQDSSKSPTAYVCIIGVDNLDTYMKKAEAAGAKPHTDKMEVPNVGWLRYYEDTEGNVFGMIQPVMTKK